MGGSDRKDFSPAQHRRNLLVRAAEAIARVPTAPITISGIPPEPLEELKSAGVLRDNDLGHSVVFTHDIYEEWALCELLVHRRANILELFRQTAESDTLIRPMQLLGAYSLETNSSPDEWKALLDVMGDTALRPVWQRAILISCVQSTLTTQLLQKLKRDLLEDDADRLRKLLLAMRTIEVLPNPFFLNQQLTPDIEPEERARLAHHTAKPKPLTWVRFLDWLMPQITVLSDSLIPDLLPFFKTWQDAFPGKKVRHCREIGVIAYSWLNEIEGDTYPRESKNYRRPFGGVRLGKDAVKLIRALFLSSAGDIPELASEYLRETASDQEDVHMFRAGILSNCNALALHLSAELVDFFLATFLEYPNERRDPFGGLSDYVFDKLGVADDHQFYPASPIQPPFLYLLRTHEDQGLRLIRGLCNHSVGIWRKARERERRYSQSGTPIPIELEFPWGAQTFWGDAQVYLWFRGVWGNDAVEFRLDGT